MSDAEKQTIDNVRETLLEAVKEGQSPASALRSSEFKLLLESFKTLAPEKRAEFGRQLNDLRKEIESLGTGESAEESLPPIDVTSPLDINMRASDELLLPTEHGSIHPITHEMERILDIGYRMGFKVVETPEIDDDFHMFGSLNFPEGHPARDAYDSFMTAELDKNGKPYIAPAHTSTMQIRVLQENAKKLIDSDQPIAYFIPGRVFRNEDVDARHEHTFYQLEGVYAGKQVSVANLMATLKDFMAAYYQKDVDLKIQPFYFPFTEPSFEFAISCPYCDKAGCHICSFSGWIELLGCGLIHPEVMKKAGLDPEVYTGFAFGIGFMRMAMIKYGIEDIRYFQSGRLEFLRSLK